MRLAGVLTTDVQGKYRIISTLPGSYGTGPPHIHFEAWGPGLRLRLWAVNLFRAPGQRPDSLWGSMIESASQRYRFRAGAEVTRIASGVFHARNDLYWDRGFEASAHGDSTRRGLLKP